MSDRRLLVEHCDECARWVHPPAGACPDCGGPLAGRPVSGRGTVFTYTVNFHPYNPDIPTPYVIAIVELDEPRGLRLAVNIVDCEPDSVRCGMPVEVRPAARADAESHSRSGFDAIPRLLAVPTAT
ncbi:Zn-ribbon domain-containing OB-fold protein [Mycobacterium celatum]|uniref:DNA-binding protein n=1 Tax=Mycobacterium celatum TaxID=28045 RepID=A0A2G5PQK8_MYCCE|nr:OB-fold domain-containing protein [Mycobacterium celatum]PIB80595.1 DNA-binding protein [Mycobacterium celatum]